MTTLHSFVRRGTSFGFVLALGVILAACSGSAPSEDSSGGRTVAVIDGVVELSAANLEFDANKITAAAGEPFTISFTNNDSAPHNVTVYVAEGGDRIGETGATINQAETTELAVEALEPGTYHFQCDIHPDMNGTIVVEA